MTRPSLARLSSDLGSLVIASLLVAAFAGGCNNSVSALSTDGGSAGSAATGSAGTHGGAGHGAQGTAGGQGAAGTGTTGAAGAGAAGAVGTKIPIGSTQCSDGIDNDGDGLIDSADPECTGPADNDEGSFATGIPGDNVDPCKQDCFFDGNSGMGDDGCEWQLKCDPLSTEPKCPYDASYAQQHATECSTSASQSQHCIDFCQKFVPNGCDCFGCCVVPGAPNPIRLATTCTAADFGDPTKCPACTQVTQCMVPCGRCEICVGKTTVPADCGPTVVDGGQPPPADGGAGTPTCSRGVSCVPGPNAICPMGYGCVTGCCVPVIP